MTGEDGGNLSQLKVFGPIKDWLVCLEEYLRSMHLSLSVLTCYYCHLGVRW